MGFDCIISQVYINYTEYLPIAGVFGDGDGDDDGDSDGDGDGDCDDDDDNDCDGDGSGGCVVEVGEGATSSVSKYSARNPRSGEKDE